MLGLRLWATYFDWGMKKAKTWIIYTGFVLLSFPHREEYNKSNLIAEVCRTVSPPISGCDRCATTVAILQRGCLSIKSKTVMPDFCSAAGCSCQRNAKTKETGITFHRYVLYLLPRDWTPQQVEQVVENLSTWFLDITSLQGLPSPPPSLNFK